MPLPPLKYKTAHVALTVPVDEPTSRDEDVRQTLRGRLHQLADLIGEQPLAEAPAEMPYLVLGGRSTQFAFSQMQADFEHEFHDAYEDDANLARELVAQRMELLLQAWGAVGAEPVWQGLIIKLRASTTGTDESSLGHVLETLMRPQIEGEAAHDAKVTLGLRLQNRYFATISIGDYSERTIQRQVPPGAGPGALAGPIRPWEGRVTDEGVELTVDVNNRYGALVEQRHTRVTVETLRAMNDLAWALTSQVAIPLAADGVFDLSTIEQAAV